MTRCSLDSQNDLVGFLDRIASAHFRPSAETFPVFQSSHTSLQVAAEQSTAIVLRTVEFSEASLIVTLLTRDLGRVSAIAKGSPPEGSFRGVTYCRLSCSRSREEFRFARFTN